MLTGKWTYRSYLNETALVGDNAAAALALIFGEGVFDLTETDGAVHGALGMGTGYALTLTGSCDAETPAHPAQFSLVGKGLDGTATAGWQYDYRGIVSPQWSTAIDQIPCMVGTVLRAKAHRPASPAGVTASFVAVRQPELPPTGSSRTFALLA